MKKKLLLGILICGMAVSASAEIYVSWIASYGFDDIGGLGIGLLGPDGSGNSTIAQLIFSADGVQDFVDPLQIGGGNGDYVTGDDVVLHQITITENGVVDPAFDEFGTFAANSPTSTYNVGNIYGRIFQDTSPALGENYYDGSMVVAENKDPFALPSADLPQNYDLNSASPPLNGDVLNKVIPEPSTFAMMALGIAALSRRVVRKRRRD